MTTREKIGGALGGIGLFLMYGTAGALEYGTISLPRFAWQFAVCCAVALIGAIIGK